MINFKNACINLYNFFWFCLEHYEWLDFRFFAPKCHGYSISGQSYEYFLHLAQLDFPMSLHWPLLYYYVPNSNVIATKTEIMTTMMSVAYQDGHSGGLYLYESYPVITTLVRK